MTGLPAPEVSTMGEGRCNEAREQASEVVLTKQESSRRDVVVRQDFVGTAGQPKRCAEAPDPSPPAGGVGGAGEKLGDYEVGPPRRSVRRRQCGDSSSIL